MAAKTATMKALGQVIRRELPDEIQAARERTRLEVERAGMAAANADGEFQRLDAFENYDPVIEATYEHPRIATLLENSMTLDGTKEESTVRALYQVARHELPELAPANLEAERARLEVERSRMIAADAEGRFQRRFFEVYPDAGAEREFSEDEEAYCRRMHPDWSTRDIQEELIYGHGGFRIIAED